MMENPDQSSEPRSVGDLDLNELRELLPPNTVLESFDPGVKSFKSFGDHGLTWLEPIIRAHFQDAEIYPPLVASALFGTYFREFDTWRSHTVTIPGSFQGAVIRSKGLGASCLHLSNQDGLVGWYGKEYRSKTVSILLTDFTMVKVATTALFELIVNPYRTPIESFIRVAETMHDIDTRTASKLALGMERGDDEYIRSAKSYFIEAYSDIGDERIFPWFPLKIDLNGDPDKNPSSQMYQFCESMVIHFLMGHELGHYYYREASSKYIGIQGKIESEIQNIVQCDFDLDDWMVEEIYCDLQGLHNCEFQRVCFGIPYSVAIYAPLFILALIQALTTSFNSPTLRSPDQSRCFLAREMALRNMLKGRNSSSNKSAISCFIDQSSEVLTKAAQIASRLNMSTT